MADVGFTWDASTASSYYYFFIQSVQSSFGGYKFISNEAEGGLIDHCAMLSVNIQTTTQMLLLWVGHTRTHLSLTPTPPIFFTLFLIDML